MPTTAEEARNDFRDVWLIQYQGGTELTLQDALYEWLYKAAVPQVGADYTLYLQVVALVVVEWAQHPTLYAYLHRGKEATIKHLARGDTSWGLLEREAFQQTVYQWERGGGNAQTASTTQ